MHGKLINRYLRPLMNDLCILFCLSVMQLESSVPHLAMFSEEVGQAVTNQHLVLLFDEVGEDLSCTEN